MKQQQGLGALSWAIAATVGLMGAERAAAMTEPEWYNCLTREVFTPEKQTWCNRWQILQNATYIVPTTLDLNPEFTTVTLTNGRYQQADGSLIVELVNQPGWLAFGNLNNDDRVDAAVILGVALDPEGRSVATYLTAALDVEGDGRSSVPVRLGERIILNSPITIANGQILVPVLTQTEVIERSFRIDGTALQEGPQRVIYPVTFDQPDGTLVFSQTSSYAVRVFLQNGRPRINLFNKQTGTLALAAVEATVEPSTTGWVYRYGGSPSVRVEVATSGSQTLAVNDTVLQDQSEVSGRVTYRVRMALPPHAVVEVTLNDVGRADAAAVVLASQAIRVGERQVPIPFELVYDPQQIDPRSSYTVQARITVDGQLRFINTTATPVITRGNPNQVEVMVEPVR